MSMKHKEHCEFEESAVLYAYGELDPAEKKAFEAHLPGCRSCSDNLKILKCANEMLSSEEKTPSGHSISAILAAAESRKRFFWQKITFFRRKTLAFAFAAIAAVFAIVLVSGINNADYGVETASVYKYDQSILGSLEDEDLDILESEISSESEDIWQ